MTATAADVEKATKLLRYLEALEPENEQRWNGPNYRGSKALEILSPSNSFCIEVRVQPSKYVCVCVRAVFLGGLRCSCAALLEERGEGE